MSLGHRIRPSRAAVIDINEDLYRNHPCERQLSLVSSLQSSLPKSMRKLAGLMSNTIGDACLDLPRSASNDVHFRTGRPIASGRCLILRLHEQRFIIESSVPI